MVRMTAAGERLETLHLDNDPLELGLALRRAGEDPQVVLEATYGWYWAADVLAEAGGQVHLAHPLGIKGFAYRRVKNDERDAADLVDLVVRDARRPLVDDQRVCCRGGRFSRRDVQPDVGGCIAANGVQVPAARLGEQIAGSPFLTGAPIAAAQMRVRSPLERMRAAVGRDAG